MEGVDLSAWRYALDGAEPVAMATLRRFADRFRRWGLRPDALRPVYGLSEASLAVTASPPAREPRALSVDARALAARGLLIGGSREVVSVGRPVPGFEVEVRDEQGRALPERRVGRVLARGPSVMAGYFGAPEATARALGPGGWLDTGDLGFVADGELYITGRAKDLVIIRGANHAPQEFEECLNGVEGVRTGATAALSIVPEGSDEEALLILAERAAGADEAGLRERVREAVLAGTGIRPHAVEILEPGTLPRTSSGKLRRREALRRYLAGELCAPARVGKLRLAAIVARSALALARAGRRG
jgi:acyl-CoA synthetase (AMP-forming)/AMP-acid ligase II